MRSGAHRAVFVYGTAQDTVNFFDSSGDDVFYGLPAYGLMNSSGGGTSQAVGFGRVNATSSAGGNDQAYLYDSPGNDSIVVGGNSTILAVPGVVTQVKGFDTVFATRTKGTDTEHVAAHDFVYQQLGGWTDV